MQIDFPVAGVQLVMLVWPFHSQAPALLGKQVSDEVGPDHSHNSNRVLFCVGSISINAQRPCGAAHSLLQHLEACHEAWKALTMFWRVLSFTWNVEHGSCEAVKERAWSDISFLLECAPGIAQSILKKSWGGCFRNPPG